MQITQACKASRFLLHALAATAATTSTKVAAHATATSACAHDKIIVAPAWQSKSTRDRREKRSAHSSRKDDQHGRASATRTLHPQQNAPFCVAHEPLPDSNSENSARAIAEQAKSTTKPRAITCYKCGKSGYVAFACNSDALPERKCYGCGGIGHMACAFATRAAQTKAQTSNSSLNVVALAGKGAAQIFAPALIDGMRVADALIDAGSAFSMLSIAFYARLRDVPVIQPFTRTAPDVVGVGGASAEIRGNVDASVDVVGVTVHHSLLVVEGLTFSLIIVTDILPAHCAVRTFNETAPVRLQNRECYICR